ncbi:MAG: hypothetical protein R3F17_09670 [Planctomycetota bacterium]
MVKDIPGGVAAAAVSVFMDACSGCSPWPSSPASRSTGTMSCGELRLPVLGVTAAMALGGAGADPPWLQSTCRWNA